MTSSAATRLRYRLRLLSPTWHPRRGCRAAAREPGPGHHHAHALAIAPTQPASAPSRSSPPAPTEINSVGNHHHTIPHHQMKKLKSNEAADKKVPLVPLNHPEFSIVKEQFPPASTAPNGGAPALPAPPEPVPSGIMSDTVPVGNTGPELSDRSPSLSGGSSSEVPKPLILQPAVRDIDPNQLHPHPLNASVYGEEIPDDAFLESISAHGILTPLQATVDNVVLSGHRRLLAAIKLGLAAVPVHVVVDAGDELSQQERILEANRFRLKNNEQLIREYLAFKRIEAEKAKLRKGQRTDMVPKSARGRSGGKARDLAAVKVNLAGSTAAKGERVVLLIDKAARSGNIDQVQKLREALNKRISKGHRKAQELGLIELEKSSRAANRKSTPKRNEETVVAKPQDSEPSGDSAESTSEPNAADHSPGASPAQPDDEAVPEASAHEAEDQTPPSSPEEQTEDRTSAVSAATDGAESLDVSSCVEFVLADGTMRPVSWQHNHLLPFKTIDKHVQAMKEHYESINSPEYTEPVLVKFQDALISVASLAVSVLGCNPTATDREIAFNALSDIRGMLPDPIPDNRGERSGRALVRPWSR